MRRSSTTGARRAPPVAGSVVYLDPPYADSVGYPEVGAFDHVEFWKTTEEWVGRGVVVRVSEYKAPAGWVAVEEFGKVQLLGVSVGATSRADVLWKHEAGA